MLTVQDLSSYYGDVRVIERASFRLEAPDVISVVGRNGIGKSTLLRAMLGFCQSRGKVLAEGNEVKGPPDVRVRTFGFSFLPQEHRVVRSLSVKANFQLAVSHRPKAFQRALSEWLDCLSRDSPPCLGCPWEELFSLAPQLAPRLSKYADQLSGGEQTLVGLVSAVLACGRYLLLDEPSASVSYEVLDTVADLLSKLSRSARYAIMLAEQNHRFALSLATRLLWITEQDELSGAIVLEVPRDILEDLQAMSVPPLDLISWLKETIWYQTQVCEREGPQYLAREGSGAR